MSIGSYAIPQIKSVNPTMNIYSFTFPANEAEEDNVLNSGIDLQFCVMKNSKNKEAVYEVLRFLYEVDTFLNRFDTDWKRYNRDLIRKVQQYKQEVGDVQ